MRIYAKAIANEIESLGSIVNNHCRDSLSHFRILGKVIFTTAGLCEKKHSCNNVYMSLLINYYNVF